MIFNYSGSFGGCDGGLLSEERESEVILPNQK